MFDDQHFVLNEPKRTKQDQSCLTGH